uniref:Uncharacterized protein n=1 Tax=Oryzias sinensis TaxID=183150 RepID=A0A8C7X3R2_9TELE
TSSSLADFLEKEPMLSFLYKPPRGGFRCSRVSPANSDQRKRMQTNKDQLRSAKTNSDQYKRKPTQTSADHQNRSLIPNPVYISIFFHHQDLNRTFAQQFFKKRFYQLFGSRDKASGQT